MMNPNCDGSGPCDPGRVRVLPAGGDANMILCRCCFERELEFRRERNKELAGDCAFQLPAWTSLKVYGEEKPTIGAVRSKTYRCKRCGHEQQIKTNHFGECYSMGHFSCCPACPPWAKYPEFGGSTTWICVEPCPAEMDKPANWQVATVAVKGEA